MGKVPVPQILILPCDSREEAVVRSRLAEWEWQLLAMENSARGLAEARTGASDLVLVSSALTNGLEAGEVCRRLKAVPTLSHVPVVMYSLRPAQQEEVQRAFEAGSEAFVDSSQVQHIARIVRALLRHKERADELRAKINELDVERRRIAQIQQRSHDATATPTDEGASLLIQRELAAGRPDGILVVDADSIIRRSDVAADELFGPGLVGKSLASIAPSSGLTAFVSNAHTEPLEGFRFDHSTRRGAPVRSVLASVLPLIGDDLPGAKAVLFVDVGKRRMAAELTLRSPASLPRDQYYDLLEAARTAYSPRAFIGSSAAASAVRARLPELALRPIGGVLLTGEPGTGLRLCARILHYAGHLPGPFLYLRCASLSPANLERELFGWSRGASSDAEAEAPGLLQLAAEGTLFLEGVEALPLPLQARLHEAFENGSTYRMGSSRRKERCVTRVLCSTHVDLAELERNGQFHPGLARWLGCESIQLLPLREHREDIDDLTACFLERFGTPRAVHGIEPRTEALLRLYDWPGNVAELGDCIERACEQATGGLIETQHLTRPLRAFRDELPDAALDDGQALARLVHNGVRPQPLAPAVARAPAARREPRPFDISDDDPVSLELYEKKALLRALEVCQGDKLKAARLLHLGKSTIYRKIKEYGIGS